MPGSPLYLLDSSVIAKWFVQEEDSDKAIEIRDLFIQKKHRVTTVSLLRYELGNVLWKHPAKTVESAREDFESLSQMAIPTLDIDDPKILTRVFETARSLEITFYDASYLTVAEESKAILVTADKKLHGRLKGRKDAILLTDWKSKAGQGRGSSETVSQRTRKSFFGAARGIGPPTRDDEMTDHD
jgi:predicted nucleic acid-binding protein